MELSKLVFNFFSYQGLTEQSIFLERNVTCYNTSVICNAFSMDNLRECPNVQNCTNLWHFLIDTAQDREDLDR